MASARVCLQWTIILFNTLSVIIGILAVVACVYELQKYAEGSAEQVEKIVQLAAASLLVISAFVGCCGAVNGSIKILCVFITMLIVLIVSHIWKLWRYDEKKQMAATEMMLSFAWLKELVTTGAIDEARDTTMNQLQESYECCGKRGSVDYMDLQVNIPISCYRVQNGLRSVYPFEEGCLSALKRAYLEVYRYERSAHWFLICFESVGILLSILLICKLLTKSRRYNY